MQKLLELESSIFVNVRQNGGGVSGPTDNLRITPCPNSVSKSSDIMIKMTNLYLDVLICLILSLLVYTRQTARTGAPDQT
jgi:hypothetical protein